MLDQAAPGQPVIAIPVLFQPNTKEIAMGEITVTVDAAPLGASAKFLDAKGNETQPDEVPEWTSSDEAVATVQASDDGMSALVTVSSPGATVIEVATVETNTGADIIAQGTITVQPGDTVVGSVEFSENAPHVEPQ